MKRFLLCFEDHRKDGRVWAVRWGRTWYRFTRVFVRGIGRTETVYLGPKARQPRAYLRGTGLLVTLRRKREALLVVVDA